MASTDLYALSHSALNTFLYADIGPQDGAGSLTIASLESDALCVTVIPHTFRNSNLPSRRTGDRLNLECDILAKYVEKMLASRSASRLSMEKLEELGF